MLPTAILTALSILLALLLLAGIRKQRREAAERRRAEAAVRASEAKFATIFHSSPDAIVLSTFPEGRILDVNESFTAATGYRREEATGRTSQGLDLCSVPDDRGRLGEALRADGRVRNLESEFRHRTGAVRTCLISADVIELAGSPSVLTMLRDISERKRAEREREELIAELEAKNASSSASPTPCPTT